MAATPFAILQLSGHQYRVEPGTVFTIDRIEGEKAAGERLTFTDILAAGDDAGNVHLGAPFLTGFKVEAEIVSHPRGEKLRVFKMKPKKRYRRTRGHRADLTTLRVTALEF